MSKNFEPDPPVRKEGDFPPTNTIPSGWVIEELTAAYNPERSTVRGSAASGPAERGGKANELAESSAASEDDSFTRRLDPFPFPGEQHSAWL